MFFVKRFLVVNFYAACVVAAALLEGAAASEKKVDFYQSVCKPVLAGSTAGLSEGFTGLPLSYFKNVAQQGKTISWYPPVWFRGFGVNAFAMVPTTAIQVVTEKALQGAFPGDDMFSSMARSTVAGVASAVGASTPAEMLILHKQNDGTSFGDVARKLIADKGVKALWRGGLAKAYRDAGFTVGFLTLYPEAERQARTWEIDDAVLPLAAAIGAGLPTAVLTHPCDTVSTRMQMNPASSAGLIDSVKEIYQEGGTSAFFRGIAPRAVRVAAALCVMGEVKKRVEGLL